MSECAKTGLQKNGCAHCRGIGDDGEAHATGPTITAQHEGACAHCGDDIVPGDSITYSNEAGGWCRTEHTDREPPRVSPHTPPPLRNEVDLSGF